MNKIVKFLIIPCLLNFSSIFGETLSLSTENKLFLSQLDEDFLEENETEEWVIFVKQIESNDEGLLEQITLSFPHQPTVAVFKEGKEKILQYEASEDAISYSMTIASIGNSTFEEYIEKLQKELSSFYVEKIEKTESAYGPCYEIVYFDSAKKNVSWNKRIFFHESKSFTLCVKNEEKASDSEKFFSSFEIVLPLK